MRPVIIFIIALLLSVFFNLYFPIVSIFPQMHSAGGIIVILTAGLSLLFNYSRFLIKKTTLIHGRTPKHLLTTGFYAYTRNPIYLCLAVILAGFALYLGNLTAFVGPIAFFLLINKLVVPSEEKILKTIFTKEYENYKKQVPRWI